MDRTATPSLEEIFTQAVEAPRSQAEPTLLPWNHLPNREHLPKVKKVSFTHDAMLDCIIQNPMMSQGELAAFFGYTQSWVSLVQSSDAFRNRLEARKAELVDPTIRTTIEERFRALATKSLEVLQRKLEAPNVSDQLAIQAASLAAKSLGIGQAPQAPAPEPDRLERLGSRLIALMGERAVLATRTLDYEIVDTPAREIQPSAAFLERNLPVSRFEGDEPREGAGDV